MSAHRLKFGLLQLGGFFGSLGGVSCSLMNFGIGHLVAGLFIGGFAGLVGGLGVFYLYSIPTESN